MQYIIEIYFLFFIFILFICRAIGSELMTQQLAY